MRKLEQLPALWTFEIADGWKVCVKIACDVDNSQYFKFSYYHGGIVNYSTFWGIYYCVYLDNEFKYATCNPTSFYKY
ncbi:MAG: hypothetical protein ACI4RG_07430, partial [Huintestinicola sp.]